MLPRLTALALLSECTGRDIWSVEYCRQKRVPDAWISELCDGYESGFRSDRETIYYGSRAVNQFEGVRDVDLAHRLAHVLGIDAERVTSMALGPEAEVRALQDAVDE